MPMQYTDEQRAALERYGYDLSAYPAGVSARNNAKDPFTWNGIKGVKFRYHICELDGIIIDGHEGSDLDPASTSCLHCPYEGSNP